MNLSIKFFKYWFPVIFWASMIFYFSNKPRMESGLEDLPSGMLFDFILRKSVHIIEYGVLTLLLYRAIKGTFRLNNNLILIYPTAAAFLYAVSDEYHQSFIPGRNACFRDVLVDSLGIFIFNIIVLSKLKRIRSKGEI